MLGVVAHDHQHLRGGGAHDGRLKFDLYGLALILRQRERAAARGDRERWFKRSDHHLQRELALVFDLQILTLR